MKCCVVTLASLAAAMFLGGCGRHGGDDDLVAWWRFDEGVGPIAADASGHGNVATLQNGGWGAGRSGAALAMNGGDDGIVTAPFIAEPARHGR